MQANIVNAELSARFGEAAFSKKFEAIALRHRLIGYWAAGLMGRLDKAAYANELHDIDVQAAGGNEMFFRLSADLSARGIYIREGELRSIVETFFAEAASAVL
jgi:hypothetical protein